jgi:hypothetical protein
VEVLLYERFQLQGKDRGLRDSDWLRDEAYKIMKDLHPETFNADGACSCTFSKHWLQNFKRRFCISCSRTNSKMPFQFFWPIVAPKNIPGSFLAMGPYLLVPHSGLYLVPALLVPH